MSNLRKTCVWPWPAPQHNLQVYIYMAYVWYTNGLFLEHGIDQSYVWHVPVYYQTYYCLSSLPHPSAARALSPPTGRQAVHQSKNKGKGRAAAAAPDQASCKAPQGNTVIGKCRESFCRCFTELLN